MKRWILCICALAMLLSMMVTPAMAADPERGNARRGQGCRRYLNVDRDGICDNRGAVCGGQYIDADNDGVCDNRPADGNGAGNFVDADNDGVCDNRGQGRNACGRGNGGQGRHLRKNR